MPTSNPLKKPGQQPASQPPRPLAPGPMPFTNTPSPNRGTPQIQPVMPSKPQTDPAPGVMPFPMKKGGA